MTTQTEAERLADALQAEFPGYEVSDVAAAELRRLASFNNDLLRVNAESLKALQSLVAATEDVSVGDYNEETHDIAVSNARVAIAKATGKTK